MLHIFGRNTFHMTGKYCSVKWQILRITLGEISSTFNDAVMRFLCSSIYVSYMLLYLFLYSKLNMLVVVEILLLQIFIFGSMYLTAYEYHHFCRVSLKTLSGSTICHWHTFQHLARWQQGIWKFGIPRCRRFYQ